MPRRKTPASLDATKDFFLWCKKNLIAEATATLPTGETLAVKFHPLAFIEVSAPQAQEAAIQELLKAARESDAKKESDRILGGTLSADEQKRKDDEDLFWSANG